MCRSIHGTDDRDKVYGLLGLEAQLNRFIMVNYSESVADVCVRAAFQVVKHLRTLSIFNYAQSSKYTQDNVPSWVPDWSISYQELDSVVGRMSLAAWFSACGIEPVYVDLVGSCTLNLKGFIIDSVIQTCVPMEDSSNVTSIRDLQPMADSWRH